MTCWWPSVSTLNSDQFVRHTTLPAVHAALWRNAWRVLTSLHSFPFLNYASISSISSSKVVAVAVSNNLPGSQNIAAGSFLRSWSFLSSSRSSPHFMEPGGLPTLAPILSYRNPDHAILPYLFRVYFNLILPSTTRSYKLSLSLRSPHQKPVFTSPVFYTWHAPHSSVGHRNNVWWAVQIIKLLVTELS
jgi:hypothetical protein